ncbi:MAG: glutaredoxin domain-containing protein [bacterium]|jgi:glutaredoxin 3
MPIPSPMRIEIYTQSYCPFCRSAIQLLDDLGAPYSHHEMDEKGPELDEIKARFDHHTIPIVVIDDALVGGFTELSKLAEQGGIETA